MYVRKLSPKENAASGKRFWVRFKFLRTGSIPLSGRTGAHNACSWPREYALIVSLCIFWLGCGDP